MGSVGAKRAGGLSNIPPTRETVTDDYGRTYEVVSRDEVPTDYELWTSGTWRGVNDDYNNGYAVFAKITDYHVDTDNGVVVRISGEDADAIKGLDGSHATSAEVERYIKRYDKPSTKGGYTRRRVERFKRGLEALRRLGI